MNNEALKHALIALVVGVLVNLIMQIVQLVGGYILHMLPALVGTAAGSTAYFYQHHNNS